MASKPSPAAPRNKNWLLVKFREWHSWGGLFLSAFILLVAVTGILLNHKDFFFHGGKTAGKKATGLLTVSSDLSAIPVSFADAMAMARDYYGDIPIEKIELKDERGALIYKVIKGGGEELQIDATTGTLSTKYGMKVAQAGTGSATRAAAGPSGLNWAKIVDDLHTGKIFGSPGKLVIDLTSGVIIALTLSGIYLWGVPLLRKRASKRRQASAPASVSASAAPSSSSGDLLARLAAKKAAQAAARRSIEPEDRPPLEPSESETSTAPEFEPALR